MLRSWQFKVATELRGFDIHSAVHNGDVGIAFTAVLQHVWQAVLSLLWNHDEAECREMIQLIFNNKGPMALYTGVDKGNKSVTGLQTASEITYGLKFEISWP